MISASCLMTSATCQPSPLYSNIKVQGFQVSIIPKNSKSTPPLKPQQITTVRATPTFTAASSLTLEKIKIHPKTSKAYHNTCRIK
jgi:hypothetical protein